MTPEELDALIAELRKVKNSLYLSELPREGHFVGKAVKALSAQAEVARERDRLAGAMRSLIADCCPANWGDDDTGADAWMSAARLVGVGLPDLDDPVNAAALARAGGDDA